MKRFVLALCFIVVSALPVAAQGPYVGVSGGVSFVHESDIQVVGSSASGDVEYDPGFGVNVAVGYSFIPARIEAEFGYKIADLDKISGPGGTLAVDSSDLTVMSYMVNGYYDFKTDSPIIPFLGAGIGMINAEFDLDGEKRDDTLFGYQLTAGITTSINENFNFDLYYRFQAAGSDFEKEGLEISYDSSNVFVGIRYNF